jgi:hypothetical protein
LASFFAFSSASFFAFSSASLRTWWLMSSML